MFFLECKHFRTSKFFHEIGFIKFNFLAYFLRDSKTLPECHLVDLMHETKDGFRPIHMRLWLKKGNKKAVVWGYGMELFSNND